MLCGCYLPLHFVRKMGRLSGGRVYEGNVEFVTGFPFLEDSCGIRLTLVVSECITSFLNLFSPFSFLLSHFLYLLSIFLV